MKELESYLLKKQITPTAMRLLVLDFLKRQSSAISLTELELGLVKSDRVTIYRTIKAFEEHGLVHRIEDGSGVTKFSLCQEECGPESHHDAHIHFYCKKCKETTCLPAFHLPEISLPEGYQQLETELIVKGTCRSCAT